MISDLINKIPKNYSKINEIKDELEFMINNKYDKYDNYLLNLRKIVSNDSLTNEQKISKIKDIVYERRK